MKKHFLLLLMAFMSVTAWALDLNESTFSANNIIYGTATFPTVSSTGAYTENTDYVVEKTKFYKTSTGADEIAASKLNETSAGTYYIKVHGTGTYSEEQVFYVSFRINKAKAFIAFDAGQQKVYGQTDPDKFTYKLYEDDAADATDLAALTPYTIDQITAMNLGLTTSRVEGENVTAAGYAFTWTCENTNYTISRVTADAANTFKITKKSISAADITLGTEKLTYNGNDQAPTITIKDGTKTITDNTFVYEYFYEATNDGGEAWTTATTTTVSGATVYPHAKAGWYKVQVSSGANSNYDMTTSGKIGPFQIAKATLNVYVNNISKEYDGTADIPATATVSYSGLQGADAGLAAPFDVVTTSSSTTTVIKAFTVNYATAPAATPTAENFYGNVGSYSLGVTQSDNADVIAKLANYDVKALTTGKLTVTAKAITVKPNAAEKELGADDDPTAWTVDATAAIAAATSPAKAGVPTAYNDQATIANAYNVSRKAGEDLGTYPMSLTVKSDEELAALAGASATDEEKATKVTEVKKTLANYTITLGTADFTISAGTLYVYPKSVGITYGSETPEFEVVATTATGTAIELTAPKPAVKFADAKYNGEGNAPKNVGTYVLTLDGDAKAEGYTNIVKLDGQYTISKKALTVKVADQVLQKDQTEASLDQEKVIFDGIVEGDEIGCKLMFNIGGEEGQIPSGAMDGAKLNVTTGTYNAGIKSVEVTSTKYANDNYTITWGTGKLIVGGAASLAFTSIDTDFDQISLYGGESVPTITWKPARNQAIGKFAGDWKAEQWNTAILPFEISARELSKAFDYALVNVVDPSRTTEDNVAFKITMGTIPANTPFAIKTDADIAADKVITFYKSTGWNLEKPAANTVSVDAGAGHKFVGVYKTTKIDKTTPKYHFMVNGAWKHIGASSSNSYNILPFNCYIDQTGSASARELTFTFEEADGTTTAIRAISVDKDENSESVKAGWYTIGGMKLQGAPAQKGIYIHNGKKIVVK